MQDDVISMHRNMPPKSIYLYIYIHIFNWANFWMFLVLIGTSFGPMFVTFCGPPLSRLPEATPSRPGAACGSLRDEMTPTPTYPGIRFQGLTHVYIYISFRFNNLTVALLAESGPLLWPKPFCLDLCGLVFRLLCYLETDQPVCFSTFFWFPALKQPAMLLQPGLIQHLQPTTFSSDLGMCLYLTKIHYLQQIHRDCDWRATLDMQHRFVISFNKFLAVCNNLLWTSSEDHVITLANQVQHRHGASWSSV